MATNNMGYVDPLFWQQQQAKSMNVPPAGTNQQPVISPEASSSIYRGGASTGVTPTQLPRSGSSTGGQTGDRLVSSLSQTDPSSYFGQINPATGNVYDYQAIATKLDLPVADVERIGLQGQMNAWNQNVAGGGAFAGQPAWTDVYAGGSAYTPVNHTLNGDYTISGKLGPSSLPNPGGEWRNPSTQSSTEDMILYPGGSKYFDESTGKWWGPNAPPYAQSGYEWVRDPAGGWIQQPISSALNGISDEESAAAGHYMGLPGFGSGAPSILARDSNGMPVTGRPRTGDGTSTGTGGTRPRTTEPGTNGGRAGIARPGPTGPGGGNMNNGMDPYGFPKTGNSPGGGFNIDPYLQTQLNRIGENSPYNDLANEKGSRLVEQLRAAEGTDSEQFANALAAQGISGGQAMSQLGKVKRNYAYGLSQGLGQIEQENLQGNINARNLALQAGLNLKGLQTNAQLGNRQMDITKMLGMEGIAKDYAKMELDNIVQMKQLGLNSQQIAMDAAIRLTGIWAQLDESSRQSLLEFYKVTTGYDLSKLVQLPQTGGTGGTTKP